MIKRLNSKSFITQTKELRSFERVRSFLQTADNWVLSQTQTTTSDASGNYSFTVSTLGAYTRVAAKSGYDFTPVQAVVAAELVLPQTVNFKGAPIQQANTPPTGNTLYSQNVNYAYKGSGALDSVGTSLIGGDALSTTNVIDSLSYRAFGKASQVVFGSSI